MPEFFQTIMGRKFYEADVPRAIKALERVASALEKQNVAPEKPIPAPVSGGVEATARALARQNYEQDGEIEFDDDAEVSLAFSGKEGDLKATGAYVQAWVYVELPKGE